MRILLVEHDRITRKDVRMALTRNGNQVVTETDRAGGTHRALTETFDVIVCDTRGAEADGLNFARDIRGAGIRSPLLAVADQDGEVDQEVGIAAGFDVFLTSYMPQQVARRASPGRPAADPAARPAVPMVPSPVRRPRGVLGGLVVIALGIPFLLQPLGVPNAASYLFIAMGAAFLVAYLRGQRVYLMPTVTLLSFGVALLLPTWLVLRPETVGPAFVGTVAIGFLVAFALAPDRRWPLVPAALLGVVAGARLLTGVSFIPAPLEPFLVPVVLVGVGTYLLIE